LLTAQPKQVPAHDPNPLPKTNQDRIVRAEKLMSSDPRLCNTSKGGKNENVTSSLVLVRTHFIPVRMAGMVLWVGD
jgi:hypothetical protein